MGNDLKSTKETRSFVYKIHSNQLLSD